MKIIRWWGILAFISIMLVIGLTGYFLAPKLIASAIEESGSELLGAKVDVANVELSLVPLSVAINQLEATDPDAPMSNIFAADQIKMSIDSSSLLWRKVVIDELVLTGVKTNTARKNSGALAQGRRTQQATEQLVELVVPDLSNVDIDSMLNNADLITLKRTQDFKQNQKLIEEQWNKALDKQAFNKRTSHIKNEFKRLSDRAKKNKLNLIKDRKDWKKLKANIDAERKNISNLSKKLKTDKAQLANQLKAIKQGPQDDLNALVDNLGVGNGIDGLVDKYLGPQYTPWVKRAIELSSQFKSSEGNTDEAEQSVVTVGDRVFFKDEKVFPDMLIKTLKLGGSHDGWQLNGNGLNIGYLPWLTGKPANLDINFDGKGKAKASINSFWQSAENMNTSVKANVEKWPLTAMTLMTTEQGNWQINSGNLAANINGELSLEKINLTASFTITNPKMAYPESLSGWQKGLASAINQQPSIQLNLTATGDIGEPKIKLDSSLESLFQKALGEQVKQKAQSLKTEIKNKLTEKIGDQSSLDNYTKQFDEWKNLLNQNNQFLDDIKNKIKL